MADFRTRAADRSGQSEIVLHIRDEANMTPQWLLGFLRIRLPPGSGLKRSRRPDRVEYNEVNRVTTVTSRDGIGRPLSITNSVNILTRLGEALTWTGDGLLNTHTLTREDFTDSRAYAYASM